MTNEITVDGLRDMLQKFTDDEKQKILADFTEIGVDLSKPKSDLTGSGVAAFIFQKKTYQADSHKDVFVKLTQLLVKQYPDRKEVVFSIKGRTKKYFSKNPSDFKNAYEHIKGTDIYVDTNESAPRLNVRCQRMMQSFGIDPSELMIITY